jgi:hypothetical protein
MKRKTILMVQRLPLVKEQAIFSFGLDQLSSVDPSPKLSKNKPGVSAREGFAKSFRRGQSELQHFVVSLQHFVVKFSGLSPEFFERVIRL